MPPTAAYAATSHAASGSSPLRRSSRAAIHALTMKPRATITPNEVTLKPPISKSTGSIENSPGREGAQEESRNGRHPREFSERQKRDKLSPIRGGGKGHWL